MKKRKHGGNSALYLLTAASLTCSLASYAEERARTDLSKIFDASAVGEPSATFVDPIDACMKLDFGKTIRAPGDSDKRLKYTIDCREVLMGSPETETQRDFDESQHWVRFSDSKRFEMQATEVTQLQWLMVMKGTKNYAPSRIKNECDPESRESYRIEDQDGGARTVTICKNHPVENVSYIDITGEGGFLDRLNSAQTQYTYRLPTEAEWEYSARGGTIRDEKERKSPTLKDLYPVYSFGDNAHDLDSYGFFWNNSDTRTHAVAQKGKNRYGLFDMHGNVWEWVSDVYHEHYGLSDLELLRSAIRLDPNVTVEDLLSKFGTAYSPIRKANVIRGGGWDSSARHLRSAARNYLLPAHRYTTVGFRLVREPRNQ